MHGNPYVQVALTYVRRPFGSPQAWSGSVGFVGMSIMCCIIFCSGSRHSIAAGPLYLPLMLVMGLFSVFIMHAKGLVAESRARLTPGFQRVHATVAAAVALVLTVLLPTVVIWLTDLRSIGLVAVMVFLLGAHCLAMTHPGTFSWPILLGFFATFTGPVKMLLWQLISGQCEPLAFILLAAGAAINLYGGIRLFGQNEDVPACHPPMCAGSAGGYQTSGPSKAGMGILPRAWQERIEENSMARWTTHARRAPASSWSSVCRWQVGVSTFWVALVVGIVGSFLFFLMLWVTGQNQRAGTRLPLMMMFFPVLPSVLSGLMGSWRIPALSRELLLPVDRSSYVRQLGMAVAIGHLEVWAGISVGLALCFLLTAAWQSSSFTDLAFALGIYALLQPWFFGVGVWFLRYRSTGMQIGSLIGAVYVSMVPAALYAAPGPLDIWRYSALPVAGIVAVLGLLITYDAYRRWLVTDLD